MIALLLVQQDPKEQVSAALKKFSDAKSYAWKGVLKTENSMQGAGALPDSNFEGSHETGAATRLLTDTSEYLKVGEKAVVRPRGDWRLVEPGGQGRGRGGMGRMFGGMGSVPRAPHEELKDAADGVEEIKQAEAKERVGEIECVVFEGKLKEDAARALSPMSRMLERMEATVAGTFRAWIGPDGGLRRFQIDIKVSAFVQDNDVEIRTIRTTTLSGVGETKVEVPGDAKKALEGPKKDF